MGEQRYIIFATEPNGERLYYVRRGVWARGRFMAMRFPLLGEALALMVEIPEPTGSVLDVAYS